MAWANMVRTSEHREEMEWSFAAAHQYSNMYGGTVFPPAPELRDALDLSSLSPLSHCLILQTTQIRY